LFAQMLLEQATFGFKGIVLQNKACEDVLSSFADVFPHSL